MPRRVATPDTWQVTSTWGVASRMAEVPSSYIAAALLPAAIITVLFYFDHNVSSQMAQQKEYGLAKPPAYHYDLLLLAGMVRWRRLRACAEAGMCEAGMCEAGMCGLRAVLRGGAA